MLKKYMTEQPVACRILENSINNKNISHAYLFVSNQYSKTMDLVKDFAKKIITSEIKSKIEKEDIINKINNGLYHDLKIIDTDGLWIKKEEIENLQIEFSNKSITGNKRIYIINNAHKLNISSSNSILKFLEEPEEKIIAILITDNKYQLLETIISRCVNINLTKGKITENDQKISTKIRIANNLFNNEKEKEKFLDDTETDILITNVIDFLIFYENNTINSILYLNKIWHDKIKDKSQLGISFDLMIMFYTDLLNNCVNQPIEIFNDYLDEIKLMCELNTFQQICKKIAVIIEMKGKIKYNVNSKLLMDKLIIKLGDEKND
ncbi:MAG: hypothetical protein PHW32_00460 [Bacilli bacterium]|nr:hypothetical protein [Bacilli bacterium]MDD4282694.1 hypothetical protein [Bacilli bacterium]MDD4718233.1 hypothetical protein [Bacilli bacterium]